MPIKTCFLTPPFMYGWAGRFPCALPLRSSGAQGHTSGQQVALDTIAIASVTGYQSTRQPMALNAEKGATPKFSPVAALQDASPSLFLVIHPTL